MKVFMLGWEFPPSISGGLGTACYGLTKAMSKLGTKIELVYNGVENNNGSAHNAPLKNMTLGILAGKLRIMPISHFKSTVLNTLMLNNRQKVWLKQNKGRLL